MRACTQPGCTGTLLDDGYCDVCGSPPESSPFVPAGDSAIAAPPTPAARPSRTAVRRVVGVASVLFLLSCAVAFYRMAPGLPTSGSTPKTTVSSAPTAGPSSPASKSPIAPTSATTPDPEGTSGSPGSAEAIRVENAPKSARPFQTVPIHGTYRGGADTFVRVQRWEGSTWVAFPVPAKTDKSGQFTAFVELPRPGRYLLRVLDAETSLASKPFVLVIMG